MQHGLREHAATGAEQSLHGAHADPHPCWERAHCREQMPGTKDAYEFVRSSQLCLCT